MSPVPGAAPSSPRAEPAGTLVDAFGRRCYRLSDCDRLPVFFMNIVSASDLWLFLASNGGLTAGRVDADGALFPYQTVDRLYDAAGHAGPVTAVLVEGASPVPWEPLSPRAARPHRISRHLYKSVEGDAVWFEEINHDLALAFRTGWSTSEEHGFLRHCELQNLGPVPRRLRVIDGLRNLQPPGIPLRLQNNSSCLADAYKTAEAVPGTTLAVYALAALIVDRAIPMESLHAAAVWSEGLPGATVMLSDRQLPALLAGAPAEPETALRGLRCSYLLSATVGLAAGASQHWLLLADTGLSQTAVAARRQAALAGDLGTAAQAGAAESTRRLRTLVGAADGFQACAHEVTTVHHFANVLFNLMRGGIFAAGYTLPGDDFAGFVARRHRAAATRHAALLAALPAELPHAELLARLAATGDANLERLGLEYLPLMFSRRHGDPSRPWNRFRIRLRDAAGRRLLAHEGNWRDIFQNWEALGLSYPGYFESFVARFVNASTPDGYNPYRLTQDGIDWEVPDHEDPWASIGYWGDHQTIYLLKLLEWSGRFRPGLLQAWLRRDLFSYAHVPYRLAPYASMRRDPHATIEFDAALHRALLAEIPAYGTDARLVRDADGGVVHVNLTEKLLLLVLTRLTNFVPGGGIWMNTQRPEWNDANNALVGYGVSVVTLAYLRRMLAHLDRELLPALGAAPVPLSGALAGLAERVLAVLQAHRAQLDAPDITDAARRALLDELAAAGSDYRAAVYRSGPGERRGVAPARLGDLVRTALAHVDRSLALNRRTDGLYHSYNLLEFTEAPAGLLLHRLAPMLEGQVAVLSSGLLSPAEATALLAALRSSALYRPDQHSYLLYPDRQLPRFLEKNVIPPDAAADCPLLGDLAAAGDTRLVVRDADGALRFHADLVNGATLEERLVALAAEPRWAAAVPAQAPQVRAVYERVFHHRAFTGRSGSMFGYEGLGCIYWHMVAKLLLAVQENLRTALAAGSPAAPQLATAYYDIRDGLGFNKTPAAYGAFPTDPYSHTPGHSGAQQPGMTGQVKEEILTRFGELGVTVAGGCVAFAPDFILASEFTTAPAVFRWTDAAGCGQALDLPAGALAFTWCGVPVVYFRDSGAARILVHEDGAAPRPLPGNRLDAALSARLFARDPALRRLEVHLGADFRPFTPPG